ncbi:MAG: nickel transporter permease NikC [Methanomethylovorans sp. PtaU1.Bin073]|nr:MAG: nickel transporter permease NikC [Methanomethylovorans sp. PtaU1.Bin073]
MRLKDIKLNDLLRNKAAFLGFIIIGIFIFTAIAADFISPYDPNKITLDDKLQPPSSKHVLGTDQLGRDQLSRMIYGTRTTFELSLIIVAITASFGVLVGIVAGYYGGMIDEIMMRIIDILLAFPSIILALVIIGALGPGILNTVIAISLVGWLYYARVARASTLSIKEKEYIEGARAMGCSEFYICTKYILPNCLPPIIVLVTLNMGGVILTIASLGFLGLGAQPPTPEWGTMLNEGREFLRDCPWLSLVPGFLIMSSVLAFNFIGDGLRDLLDPRQQVIK